MIIAIFNVYLVILFLLVRLHVVRFSPFWKISPAIVLVALMFGLFIPMGWGAPSGPALVIRNSVPIVPGVSGRVIEVPVEANAPLKEGAVLFRIDRVNYQATVDQYAAQIERDKAALEKDRVNLVRYRGLAAENSIARQQMEDQQRIVEEGEATIKLDQALLDGAQADLDKTIVVAPADGYVTNLALRKGARVTSAPVAPAMAFIDTSETIVGVEIRQLDARYIERGQPVELTFKFFPGRIVTAKVVDVLQAISSGQVQASGLAATPIEVQTAPFVVRVKLNDDAFARALPAGSAGTAAIYTDHVKPSHIIRKVLLRQIAILNYINPF
jgi:RND family efflux transporter MFP subunit